MPVDQPVEFLIDYWGGCPECGMQDGNCELGEGGGGYVWFYCDAHRTRWSPGNPFTSKPVYGERRREILGYRVMPWEDLPHDPVWWCEDGEYVEKSWLAIRARFPGIVPCVVPDFLTMTRVKRIAALRDLDRARRAAEERHAALMGSTFSRNGVRLL